MDQLPEEPGVIVIRGPRSYGKSTWMELALRASALKFGKASSFYLNGDDLSSKEALEQELLALEAAFRKDAVVKRIFNDEITAIDVWEKTVKRL